jgi:hypothetical protein
MISASLQRGAPPWQLDQHVCLPRRRQPPDTITRICEGTDDQTDRFTFAIAVLALFPAGDWRLLIVVLRALEGDLSAATKLWDTLFPEQARLLPLPAVSKARSICGGVLERIGALRSHERRRRG